jgi:two-component system LytT family sensor kinase
MQSSRPMTELSFLKAQVNPHFLFNTLNNIYSLAVRKSDDAPQAVMMLADMMRYVLSDAQSDHVPLDKDLEYISEYIKLQKLRLTDKVTIQYTVTGNTADREIAPLMLIPFVENAFKYGTSTHEESTITIDIRIEGDKLIAYVVNKLVSQAVQMQKATGTGLVNVRRRLELLYADRHTLDINTDDDGYYKVYLQLNLA